MGPTVQTVPKCSVSLLQKSKRNRCSDILFNHFVLVLLRSAQMFMAFTHMVLRAKKQSQNRAEREREREKDTVNINAHRDRDRRKRGKKCC